MHHLIYRLIHTFVHMGRKFARNVHRVTSEGNVEEEKYEGNVQRVNVLGKSPRQNRGGKKEVDKEFELGSVRLYMVESIFYQCFYGLLTFISS